MRTIDHIVIHCSATREDRSLTVAELEENHRCRGFRGVNIPVDDIRYLYRIQSFGSPSYALELVGAHAKGHNSHSIGICYEGGLDVRGRAKDTRTPEQRSALRLLVHQLLKRFRNNVRICGHRDLSPDLNGDGVIEPEEWIKECPCFEVSREL